MAQNEGFVAEKGRRLSVNRRMCMWCGACVGICPKNAITLHETRIEFYDECDLCGTCLKACPVGAVSMVKTGEKDAVGASGEGVGS